MSTTRVCFSVSMSQSISCSWLPAKYTCPLLFSPKFLNNMHWRSLNRSDLCVNRVRPRRLDKRSEFFVRERTPSRQVDICLGLYNNIRTNKCHVWQLEEIPDVTFVIDVKRSVFDQIIVARLTGHKAGEVTRVIAQPDEFFFCIETKTGHSSWFAGC